ncbi:HWE histidine kinase domain-containing protein [Sphingomonas sp. ID0503]|uniref:HWE histidine kinase domain-containing protein n=1 Tax=Sphingomonas sp. ID0503 TaxID=3399691 RepID=UPI003AFA3365
MNEIPSPVDLTNCDREPIHLLGAIQPIGFLVAVTSDWLISRVSRNIGDYTGREAEPLIGLPLTEIFTADAIHSIRNRMTVMRGEDSMERLFAHCLFDNDRLFDVAVHFSNGTIVIEAEPSDAADSIDAAGTVRLMMSRLDDTNTLDAFFREGARQVRALTGFDRVMVYRFDDAGSGEVVAEAARSGLGSFMGLRYPASDIPAQARKLYQRNIFRVIADIEAKPVPIFPALDTAGNQLDLSLSIMRSVSPIHIEYLKNMGVGASLSISIIVEGRLWGLFACHHYSPRCPSFERRTTAELFGQMFAMKLESRERKEAADYQRRARDVSDRILAAIAGDASLLDDPSWLTETIGKAIPADGIAVWIDGRQATSGMTPPADALAALVRTLNGTAASRVFATDRIAGFFPAGEVWSDRAAGLMAIPISRSPRDYVILFRQEMVRTVRWAGDPHKPIEYGPNGPRLTPRKSFEAWSELVHGRSQPFSPAEMGVAEALRATLIEVVLRLSDAAHAERERFGERQELLIAELNHRVRNILSLIRGIIRQSRRDGVSSDAYIAEVDGRVQALARAHNQITEDHWGPAPLANLIETEAGAYLPHRAEALKMSGPDVLLDPLAFSTMALVVHELMTNCVKYGSLSRDGTLAVNWKRTADGDLLVEWTERGGPPVQAPTREGFGSTIIGRSVPYDLGGKADIRYRLGGLEASFCIPARHVTVRAERIVRDAVTPQYDHGAGEDPAKIARALEGQTVLLVEDSLIIALDAEDLLMGLGAKRVLPAAGVRDALSTIDRDQPSLAILDINLGDQVSFPIASRLKELGVPFIFATGYGEQAQLPGELAESGILQKPFTAERLVAAITRIAD